MKRNRARLGLFLLPTLAALTCPVAVQAGDGLYLGLEGGANFPFNQTLRIYNYPPLLGLGGAPDGTPISNVGFGTGYVGGLTFGYAFPFGLRTELELAHRDNWFNSIQLANGNQSNVVQGHETNDIGFGNLWFDFFKSSWVHPYLGAGAGIARVAIRHPGTDSNGLFYNGSGLQSDFDAVFAYQGGAGLRFDLGHHWSASLDYRYLRTETAQFNLLRNNPDSHVETPYATHSALFSIHYYFSAPPAPAPEPPAEPVTVVPLAEPSPPAESAPAEAEAPPPAAATPCTPPVAGQPVNLDGCAAGDVIVLRGVNFNTNQSTLTVNAKRLLDGVAAELARRGEISFEIDGHTDSQGSDAFNQRLSEKRAASVMRYLETKGIAASRMSARGYGESMPISDNTSDAGRELNRRVELKVTGTAAK